MVDWKLLLKWDLWAAAFYGVGQALLFVLWLSVAFAILNSYSPSLIGSDSYYVAGVLGGVGSYWYAVRKYEKVIK